MGIFAGFIGIDRHEDPQVRDLTGAVRDATALWALFSDSLPDIKAALLTDSEATRAGVDGVLAGTLDAAGPEDVVLLSFAGHGTRDHRLVMHDTRGDDVPGTTLDMADVAARFKASKARVVLCLLDCCFAGGAPARVLDDGPILRDGAFPLADVGGKGRVLFAASNVDQSALEDPKARHGLFTRALLECLQQAPAPVSILGVVEQVVKAVRAGAARQGYEQTPVVFGHIEGELSFPAMVRGDTYCAHFPEYGGIKVGADFADLAAYGIAPEVLDLWAQRFAGGLNELQRAAINEFGVLDGRSLLSVAPTSAGKTFIGELGAVKAVAQGEKAVFLLPYKALVDEKYEEFAELYGARLGLRVARCSGDWQDQTGAILRSKYDIAFFTYETFLGLAVASPYMLSQIGLVVVDEAQFITDARRGIVVELLLTNLISARARDVAPQIICLSAVIGNTNGFEKWLGCEVQLATERPVPLLEGVMDRGGVWQHKNVAGDVERKELLQAWDIRQRRNKPSSQDQIVPLVRKLVGEGEKVIVFRNTRGSAAGCAAYLAAELGLPPAQEVIEALPQLDRSGSSEKLRQCLAGGTAFHTTNLNREERGLVEAAFRDPEGPVRVLAATTTVAAGVNTPASSVIIAELEFRGADGAVPFTVATYKNMAGRAGRLGFEDEGKAIVLADTGMERERLYARYVEGVPEPISSSFDEGAPETWLIRLLAQVKRVTREQAIDLIANTYGGFLANLARPGWMEAMEGGLRALLARMEEDGLVEADGPDHIQLSILGRACGRSPLSLRSAMRLIEMLRDIGAENVSAQNLLALVQALPEQDDRYTPLARGRAEAGWPGSCAAHYGGMVMRLLERGAGEDRVYLRRCKRALILAEWTGGVAMGEIENRYSANAFVPVGPGDVRGLADSTRFYIASAAEIASIVHRQAQLGEEEMDGLLRQLDLGLPADGLGLAETPVVLERGEYLALYRAGARTVDDVAALERARLGTMLGERRAEEIAAVLSERGEAA